MDQSRQSLNICCPYLSGLVLISVPDLPGHPLRSGVLLREPALVVVESSSGRWRLLPAERALALPRGRQDAAAVRVRALVLLAVAVVVADGLGGYPEVAGGGAEATAGIVLVLEAWNIKYCFNTCPQKCLVPCVTLERKSCSGFKERREGKGQGDKT